jgi:hypothetical protein
MPSPMCGRYSSALPPELIARVFGTVNVLPNSPAVILKIKSA